MQPLLLLHGALGASDQLQPLKEKLATSYHIHTFDFSGHGTSPFRGAFSIPRFAEEILEYLDLHKTERISIFGYSMGGYAALYLALRFPERIEKIITLASKLQWSREIAEKEVMMLDPEKIAAKVPKFAEALERRHTAMNWKELMNETAAMMKDMGENNPLQPDDYAKIKTPVLLLLGDRDKMVSYEETDTAFRSLADAQLGILPNTPHPLEQVNLPVLESMMISFL